MADRPTGTPIDPGLVARIASGARGIATAVRYTITGVDPSGFFSPMQPMAPQAPPADAGRQFDYPVGYNLQQQPRAYESIGFGTLRALADNCDIVRLMIETRKDQMEKLAWNIKPRILPGEKGANKKRNDRSDSRIGVIEEFFSRPDRRHDWAQWQRAILEEMFVTDATTLYRQRDRAGRLYALQLIDGASIRPLIDDFGRSPPPPSPAFQQFIKGFGAWDYTEDQLLYRPRNVRAHKVYGYSHVEQILTTINIVLRRTTWQLSHWTEGNVPEALIGTPEAWGPKQVAEFQELWDALLVGNIGERRRARFVPGDIAKNYVPTKGTDDKNEQDEWLARIVCFAFSISPAPFVKQMNRATAQSLSDASLNEGLAPIKVWIKSTIDGEIRRADGFASPDLEFVWNDEDDVDPAVQAITNKTYVDTGIKLRDEAREDIGLDPLPAGMGSVPLITGTTERLEDAVAEPVDPMGIDPESGLPLTGKSGSVEGAPGTQKPKGPSSAGSGKPTDAKGADQASKAVEVGELAKAPFRRRKRLVVPKRARAVGSSTKELTTAYTAALAQLGRDAARQVRSSYREHVNKAAGDDRNSLPHAASTAAAIMADYSTAKWAMLINPTEELLQQIMEGTGAAALAQVGFKNDTSLVEQVHEDAVVAAEDRAAELVGMKRIAGHLVPNPDARWAITDSTRDMLQATIVQAVQEGWSSDKLASEIEGSYAFSADRAEVIARTELAHANMQGAMMGYRATGQVAAKVWLTADDDKVSEDCMANAAAGEVALDDAFPSGDVAPPAHPNCRCDIAAVLNEEEDSDQ